MSRTPLVEAAPFVDPRSPDNNILRTPLDKSSGFKGFQLDESLPYIDESQESAPPTSPPLSLSPMNLDLSGEEDGGGEEGGGGSAELSLDMSPAGTPLDMSPAGTPLDMSPAGTPPDNFNDAVKEFDAAIGEELEKEETLNEAAAANDAAANEAATNGAAANNAAANEAAAASAGTRCYEFVGGDFSADNQMMAGRLSTGEFSSASSRSSSIVQPAALVTSSSR